MTEITPGFTACPGDKAPSAKRWGANVMVQLRCGIVAGPWPIKTTRWVHDGTAGDVVAIRRGEE